MLCSIEADKKYFFVSFLGNWVYNKRWSGHIASNFFLSYIEDGANLNNHLFDPLRNREVGGCAFKMKKRSLFSWIFALIFAGSDCNVNYSFWDVVLHITEQQMKFYMKDFFSKCGQICSFLRIWSHLMKKSLIENFIFCNVFFFSKLLLII